jgi:hypothetical protein
MDDINLNKVTRSYLFSLKLKGFHRNDNVKMFFVSALWFFEDKVQIEALLVQPKNVAFSLSLCAAFNDIDKKWFLH